MFTLWMAKTFSGLGIYIHNVFVKPGTQINGMYRDEMLLLRTVWSVADEVYIFSPGQYTGSSCTQSCFVVKLPKSLLLTCSHPSARILVRLITAFGEGCRDECKVPNANTGHGRAATEVDEYVGWLPAECSSRSSRSVVKETWCLLSCIMRSYW